MSSPSVEPFWANFKYERLPVFCFICGILGHSEKFCPKLFADQVEDFVRPYGAFMRAPDKRIQRQIGARWLRDSMANPVMPDSEIGPIQKPVSPKVELLDRAVLSN